MKAFIVAGLFLGDEGKGSIVDWLATQYAPQVDVIRYCGGPQAAHNICHADGKHHTFAQFGSGMLNLGVRTHIAQKMVIEPGDFLREAKTLEGKGVADAMERLSIDRDCVIMAPWHTAFRRIQELYWRKVEGRGHGTCGRGVGTAVEYAQDYDDAPRAKDLLDQDLLAKKLSLCQERMILEAEPLANDAGDEAKEILRKASNPNMLDVVLDDWSSYSTKYRASIVDDQSYFQELERSNRTVILESTQGTLLDRRIGFLPYVANSEVAISAARQLLAKHVPGCQSKAIGVVRGYAIRHGDGPLPTQFQKIPQGLCDDFNGPNPWQGEMKFGALDMVLLKYATIAGGKPDMLALTCVDQLQDLEEIPACTSYSFFAQPQEKELLSAFCWHDSFFGSVRISGINTANGLPSEQARAQAAQILFKAKPDTFEKFANSEELHEYLETELQTPIGIISMGSKNSEKAMIGDYL